MEIRKLRDVNWRLSSSVAVKNPGVERIACHISYSRSEFEWETWSFKGKEIGRTVVGKLTRHSYNVEKDNVQASDERTSK